MDPRNFRVLFADPYGFRHCDFRVRPGKEDKRPVVQRHVYNLKEFKNAINETKFNVVFIPSYWQERHTLQVEDKEASRDVVATLIALPPERRPDLVVYHGFYDDYKIVNQLVEAGLMAAHIPWAYADPSSHERKK